jgi:hypothetical protein
VIQTEHQPDAIVPGYQPHQPVYVTITDIDVKFMSMVWLFIKASIAVIPASIVVAIIYYGIERLALTYLNH